MTLPAEIEVLRDVVERLDRLGFAYMLTGSLAMGYYAQPRMTRDLDFVVALSLGDAPALEQTFAVDYYVPADLADAIERESLFNLIHLDTVTKVDVIVRKNTPYRIHEFQRRQRITVAGLTLWIVTKEDLMLSKLEWAQDSHSEVQFRDIHSLAATGYDVDYLGHWIVELALEDVWQRAKHA